MMKVIANMTHHNDDLRRSNIQRWRTQQLRKSQIQNSLDWRRRRFKMLMMMTMMMRKAMTWTLLVTFGDKYNGTISVKLMSENLSLLMNLVSLPMSYSYINCFRCLALMREKGNGFCHFFDIKTLIFHSFHNSSSPCVFVKNICNEHWTTNFPSPYVPNSPLYFLRCFLLIWHLGHGLPQRFCWVRVQPVTVASLRTKI